MRQKSRWVPTAYQELHVLLSTARVVIEDDSGRQYVGRALLDPESQSHLISEDLVKRIGISTTKRKQSISGVSKITTNINRVAQVTIRSIYGGFTEKIDCLILPTITVRLPQVKIDKSKINILSWIQLADTAFDEPKPIDLLIEVSLFWSLLCEEQLKVR